MDRIRKTVGTAGLVAAAMMLLPAMAWSDGGSRAYEVTITNLTAGQPFTPPVLATHRRGTGVFSLGEPSSPEVQAVAENGDTGPLVAMLLADPKVHEVVQGTAPLVPAHDPGGSGFGSSETYTIHATKRARFLSIASMLICTNDGFTGLDGVHLPKRGKTVVAVAYDARSEMNTEDFADMVPPCQGLIGVTSDDPGTGDTDPLLAEDGVVIPHAGVHGGVDLVPAVHDWSDPVASIVIRRVRDHDDDDDDDDDEDED